MKAASEPRTRSSGRGDVGTDGPRFRLAMLLRKEATVCDHPRRIKQPLFSHSSAEIPDFQTFQSIRGAAARQIRDIRQPESVEGPRARTRITNTPETGPNREIPHSAGFIFLWCVSPASSAGCPGAHYAPAAAAAAAHRGPSFQAGGGVGGESPEVQRRFGCSPLILSTPSPGCTCPTPSSP